MKSTKPAEMRAIDPAQVGEVTRPRHLLRRYALALATAALLGGGTGVALAATLGENPVPDDVIDEPVAVGPIVRIARGPAPPHGAPWTLNGYESDNGLCLSLEGLAPENLGTGACGFDVSAESGLSVVTSTSLSPSITAVYGLVADSDSSSVTITTESDGVRTIPTIPSPADLEYRGDFFALTASGTADVERVVARTATGEIVALDP